MRIEERGNVLIARATPECMWLFGLWFVAGGTLAMTMTFAVSNAHELTWWGRLFVFTIGVGCAAAAFSRSSVRQRSAPSSIGRATE